MKIPKFYEKTSIKIFDSFDSSVVLFSLYSVACKMGLVKVLNLCLT